MYPKKCAECGGVVVSSTASLPFDVRGETLRVDGIEHGLCTDCGEVYLSLEAAEVLQSKAIRASKAAKGLLSPEEIRELRRSLALSQAAFEDLLGVGAKTVVRWEKGTVFQSATADRMMRLIRLFPDLTSILVSGELYGAGSGCGRGASRLALSRGWSVSPAKSVHLKVVMNGDNAAAA
ncbi:MAG: type II TA system antitoxin MqsA family protein [Thermoleophilia bacterium]